MVITYIWIGEDCIGFYCEPYIIWLEIIKVDFFDTRSFMQSFTASTGMNGIVMHLFVKLFDNLSMFNQQLSLKVRDPEG